MLGAVFCVLLPVAFVDRAKLHVQTMPHGQVFVDRAAGLRRLQQPDSPVQDPTPCPLQDNDTAVALYGGPHGLYTCGDVAPALQCSKFLPACPQSCGVGDGTADLSLFCHCFEGGWTYETECRGYA